MTPLAIEALAHAVPSAVQQCLPAPVWPETIRVIGESDPAADEIEEGLFPIPSPGDADPLDELNPEIPMTEAAVAVSVLLADASAPADAPATPSEIIEQLGDIFGAKSGWPGAPGGVPPPSGGTSKTPHPANPDTYAFYLPWHRFSPEQWGIYLIVEGIELLGQEIHHRAKAYLSLGESRRAAKMFLFHHEAYHNAVETFASRIEVSHRSPCYLTGVHTTFKRLLPISYLHEEGLANAYAHDKVRRLFLADVAMDARRRTLKRYAAALALRFLERQNSTFYASCERVLSGNISFGEAEREFQESIHSLSSLVTPSVASDIWKAAPRAMTPSLSRNGSFSYVVGRAHPLGRAPALVPHYDRREVVRRLRLAAGARKAKGGEHPHVVTSTGRQVSVPGHPELPRGTVRKILKQTGLQISLSQFMGASDKELRAMGGNT